MIALAGQLLVGCTTGAIPHARDKKKGDASMTTYRVAVIGCSRMGGFIDDEVADRAPWMLPYSHAAGYTAVERTELVACADVRPEAVERFAERYGIPPSGRYTDYRQLILEQKPDIVSIATQPEQRAEIAIFACENGVKALYCEKALCASLAEADAIVDAVERHGVVLNMGTNRRWDEGYDAMKAVIDSGELGQLKSFVIYNNGTLFNTSSHTLDLALRIAGDPSPVWAQAHLPGIDESFPDDIVPVDPTAEGMIQLDNGVRIYMMLTPRHSEYEAICERGSITAFSNGTGWQMRRRVGDRLEIVPYDPGERTKSSTQHLIEDLVQALDTGNPPRGGVRIARTNMEMLIGCIESHRQGGARVALPLEGSTLRFDRYAQKGSAKSSAS